jgi:uncharacterized protein YjiS (DUF1127 family)
METVMSKVLSRTFAGPAVPRPRHLQPLAALWRDIVGSWRHAVASRRYEHIDDATLRDIGVSRSELSSFDAEARGLAEPTRVRVISNYLRLGSM